jgi:signal transduction histidine kinase/CheY-like chemotaxis protein
MVIPLRLKFRKVIHVVLFIAIIVIQILVYKMWDLQKNVQNGLTESIQDVIKPNRLLEYSNLATDYYFDAESQFTSYLLNGEAHSLNSYKKSIQTMSLYLDSLSVLTHKNNSVLKSIDAKQKTENEVLLLKKELDSLMKLDIILKPQKRNTPAPIQKYDYNKVLSSITYDTVKKITEAKKKGLFGRIGSALSGKSDIKKEEMQSTIRMVFNNQEKNGTFEDQLKNVFLFSDKYYGNQFAKLKNSYGSLKEKDRELLQIKKNILNKSRVLLVLYSISAQETGKIKHSKAIALYGQESNYQKAIILKLLLAMSIITFLLLLYSIWAFVFEGNLAKAKSQAERNLDIKNRLVGMLSHEMRAPLGVISNLSDGLKARNSDSGLNQMIDTMLFTSNSLQITVNQVLDYFKNKNTKLVLYHTQVNLYNEITSTLDSLRTLSEVKSIQIVSNLNPNLNREVWVDNVKIHQLFYNIIGNAIKFTNKGMISVAANLAETADHLRLDVTIKDTGVGIPKEDVAKVFDKFYQSQSHKEQISFGAGLGLSLCKEIIELFDGEITVESETNQGTSIGFYLLFGKSIKDKETFQTQLMNTFEGKNVTVAVVDDDALVLTIVKKLLSNINFKVVAFDNAIAVKDYLENQLVDIIITDIQIFEYSGIKLAGEIRHLENQNASCPIVALTGDSYINSVDLKKINIDEVIMKPINKEEFYQKILKVLS